MKELKLNVDHITIRIKDADVHNKINKILANGEYSTINALMNEILDKGVEQLYKEMFTPEKIVKEELAQARIEKIVKEVGNTVVEQSVKIEMIRSMVASLFKALEKLGDGEPIIKEMMEGGMYADLPPYIQRVEDEVIRQYKEKLAFAKKNKKESNDD